MKTPLSKKSTTKEIKERFDNDVERFSNLETGQQAIIDAPLMMDLLSNAAAKTTPHAKRLLDIGCGGGDTVWGSESIMGIPHEQPIGYSARSTLRN